MKVRNLKFGKFKIPSFRLRKKRKSKTYIKVLWVCPVILFKPLLIAAESDEEQPLLATSAHQGVSKKKRILTLKDLHDEEDDGEESEEDQFYDTESSVEDISIVERRGFARLHVKSLSCSDLNHAKLKGAHSDIDIVGENPLPSEEEERTLKRSRSLVFLAEEEPPVRKIIRRTSSMLQLPTTQHNHEEDERETKHHVTIVNIVELHINSRQRFFPLKRPDEIRILSIDSGGVRGILPAIYLEMIERLTGLYIADMFDLIVGTSTGGICAAGCVMHARDESGRRIRRPKFSGKQAVELYQKKAKVIFAPPSRYHRWTTFGGVLGTKYLASNIEEVFKEAYEDETLSEGLASIIMPAMELSKAEGYQFNSRYARLDPRWDFKLRDAVRATTSAPSYFEPAKITNEHGDKLELIDGASFGYNPAIFGYIEALKVYPNVPKLTIVSLGTGEEKVSLSHAKTKGWGGLSWAESFINLTLKGHGDATDLLLRTVLKGEGKRYHRFQLKLEKGKETMDDASDVNIRNLIADGARSLAENSEELEELCAYLRENTTNTMGVPE